MMMRNKIILCLTVVVLTLIPFLWGKLYFVGGDDSKLYYLFPFEYFKNFTLHIISDNLLGSLGYYFPQSYISPFAFFLFLVKKVFTGNIQFLFLGLNISLGFLFFYILLGIWIKNETLSNFLIKVITSLFYIFSSFTIYTVWQHQLFVVYLLSVFPLVLYLFTRGLIKNNISFIILGSLVLSLFSILLLSVPWLVALMITISPIMLYFLVQHKIRFLLFSSIFVVLILLLNYYWLIHLIDPALSSSNGSNSLLSVPVPSNIGQADEYVIREVTKNNQILYPILNLFHNDLQVDFNWQTYPIYSSWHLKLLPLNALFLIIILFAGVMQKKSDRFLYKMYSISLISFLIALFFFTVKIGNWGLDIFLWLANHIPGFFMFRNNFDKFSLAMTFSYALLLGISLKIIFDNIVSSAYKYSLCLILFLLILLNAKPFILGEYYKIPLWSTKNTFTSISDFNQDFYDLVNYISKIEDPSRFLWLPFNNVNYVLIQDKNLSNHYYLGVSPLQFLAQKSDYTGFLSFPPNLSTSLRQKILKQDIAQIGHFFQTMNVKYIIVNKNISRELQQSYLYSSNSKGDLYAIQNAKFVKDLTGENEANFGKRYSLYKIADKFSNEKIYLSDKINEIPSSFLNLTYTKKASYLYEVKITGLKKEKKLIFLDPYHDQWKLYVDDLRTGPLELKHETVLTYANGWTIDPSYIKTIVPSKYYKINEDGSIDIKFLLFFKPQLKTLSASSVSYTTFIILILILGYNIFKRIYSILINKSLKK